MSIPDIALRHGARIPVLGLGTWPMDDAETAAAVRAAAEQGYRLFDTAENYRNEVGVGRGISDTGLSREEVFVTTKFNKRWHSVEGARQALESSLERLDLDYVDLLLIHWPIPAQGRYVDAFAGLVELLRAGAIRAIGTSNFKPAHLQRVIDETGEVPDLNQIQLSPYTTRAEARAFHCDHRIETQSWSPIKAAGLLVDPVVTRIADEVGRTPGQVVLRWHLQLGLLTVVKSSRPERMIENAALFDFELTNEQVAALTALDRGEDAAQDSDLHGH